MRIVKRTNDTNSHGMYNVVVCNKGSVQRGMSCGEVVLCAFAHTRKTPLCNFKPQEIAGVLHEGWKYNRCDGDGRAGVIDEHYQAIASKLKIQIHPCRIYGGFSDPMNESSKHNTHVDECTKAALLKLLMSGRDSTASWVFTTCGKRRRVGHHTLISVSFPIVSWFDSIDRGDGGASVRVYKSFANFIDDFISTAHGRLWTLCRLSYVLV